MKLRSVLLLAVVCLSVTLHAGKHAGYAGAAPRQDGVTPEKAPEFIGTELDWVNTEPLKMSGLRGKVVLVDYWEYTCVNCIRTLPYLKEWNKRYAKDGLVIVGIHTPEFEFARDRRNVTQAVKQLGITWPVLIDSDHKNWDAYRNSYWPRKYFIDRNGRIVHDHSGEGDYQESEQWIQKLLKQANPSLTFPKILTPIRDTDMPGAVCYPTTRETYVGARGAATGQLGNVAPFEPGRTSTFEDALGDHPDGLVFAQGVWTTQAESLQHGRTTTMLTDYIALKYHALEANAVIKPEGSTPFKLYLKQDGAPIAKTDAGADVLYDDQGQSYINVVEPRMYRLTKNAKFGSHELKMATNSPDFGLYSFTFSSCQVN